MKQPKLECPRCGGDMRSNTMSIFNTDIICLLCKEDERLAPGYPCAQRAEVAAVLGGDYNYPGIGLSDADYVFLAERRSAREAAQPERERDPRDEFPPDDTSPESLYDRRGGR